MNSSYPITLNPHHFRPLIVGGGNVAVRKLKTLLASGFLPAVLSPVLSPEMDILTQQHGLKVCLQPWSDDLPADYNLIIAATSDHGLNSHISRYCTARNLLVNNVSTPSEGSFFTPAVVSRNGLKIAVSTDGEMPLLSAMIRQHIDAHIHPDADKLLQKISTLRQEIIQNNMLSPEEKQGAIDQQLKPLAEEIMRILFTL